MKKIYWLLFFLLNNYVLLSQSISASFRGGFMNYQGDLQDRGYTLTEAHGAVGAGITVDLSGHLAVSAGFTYGKISGSDSLQKRNTSRNLSFSSPISDYSFEVTYNFIDLNKYNFTPYILTGISYFHFNPSTIDASGKKTYLQPLSTEGQGFYKNRKMYKLNQLAIPMGFGIKYSLNKKLIIGFEVGFRKTSTDYLDDLSTDYVDKNLLLANRGQEAVNLAFRSNEKNPNLSYPADGTQRGNVHLKDWYYFSVFTLTFKLPYAWDKDAKRFKTTKMPTDEKGCPSYL